MSRSRDISIILGVTEAANTGNDALSSGAAGLDSSSVISLVDSSYVAAREADAGGGVDSATAIGGVNTIYSSLNKAWWNIDENNDVVDDSFNVSSHTNITTGSGQANLSVTMANATYSVALTTATLDNLPTVFGSFETTTVVPWRCRAVGGSSSSNQDVNNLHGILSGDLA